MVQTNKVETYKGFELDFFICRKGFNQYSINISKYKYKGTKQEEYYHHKLSFYTNIKSTARKEVKQFINNLKEVKYCSSGLLKCDYLPNYN